MSLIRSVLQDHATALAASWQSLALSADGGHLLGVYGDDSSWALLYNVYADRLLGTGIVSPDVSGFEGRCLLPAYSSAAAPETDRVL